MALLTAFLDDPIGEPKRMAFSGSVIFSSGKEDSIHSLVESSTQISSDLAGLIQL